MAWITRFIKAAVFLLLSGTVVPGSFDLAIPIAQVPARQPTAKYPFGPIWSVSTSTLLDRQGLAEIVRKHPADVFSLLEQSTDTQRPDCTQLLALAELADQIAQTAAADEALARSRDAAVYAVFCLETMRFDRAGMAIGCAAHDAHNRAVERCLQLRGPGKASGPGAGRWGNHCGGDGPRMDGSGV